MKTRKLKRLSTVSVVAIGCAAAAAMWFNWHEWFRPRPQDYEQCSAQAEKTGSSGDERTTLLAECDKKYVARRKVGGGYTYYDFLQNRQFEIAGPNPTREEQKHFDEQYSLYLKAQKQEADAARLAGQETRNPDLKDDRVVGPPSSPGPPRVITPSRVPIPKPRSSVLPPVASCEESSPSCSWEKFTAGIKKFFQSNADESRP
ncbi:hypothetical protein [Bradyrhizobium canariense]|uniref:hypothetical protein n=1 Tax=Bradyrhizobium canariense TaxID=255045 RepID=UPI0011786B6E|nr:hypothetical protein [Bradyrhizobium canariense]